MNQSIIVCVLSGLSVLFTGCAVETVSYDSGYSNDYVYSVGYYENRPYWGNNYYYYGYGVRPYGYWGTYEYYSNY